MRYPWQEQDWCCFEKSRESVPNAWLLSGPKGIGKRAFAEEMAHTLLCDHPEQAPCGQCESCYWFQHGNHPDFYVLTGQETPDEGKTTRSRDVIKVDSVRALIDALVLSGHHSKRRIALLDPADSLHGPSASALLKMLEEPPEGVLFLLISHAPGRLLPTIRSRCRAFRLKPPEPVLALAWLKEQKQEAAETQLAFYGGRPLLIGNDEFAVLRQNFIDGMGILRLDNMLQLAASVNKLALHIPLEWIAKWLHDLMRLKFSGKIDYYPKEAKVLSELAAKAEAQTLIGCQDKLNQLLPLGYHTLNTGLQIEDILMDYLMIFAPK